MGKWIYSFLIGLIVTDTFHCHISNVHTEKLIRLRPNSVAVLRGLYLRFHHTPAKRQLLHITSARTTPTATMIG